MAVVSGLAIQLDLDDVAAVCRRHRISRLSLFGSVLRDDVGPESDIDVLVEFESGGRCLALPYSRCRMRFSQLIGRKVDFLTPAILGRQFRAEVLASTRPLYVAPRPSPDAGADARVLRASSGSTRYDDRGGSQRNPVHSLALTRALELIGDAANRLPADIRLDHPEVPWRSLINFRNVLAHGYDDTDMDIAVTVVRDDLPDLRGQLRDLIFRLRRGDATA